MNRKPKTQMVIYTEKFLYFFVPFAGIMSTFMLSDMVLTGRSMTGQLLAALGAGAIALKASFSSTSDQEVGATVPEARKKKAILPSPPTAYASNTTTKTTYRPPDAKP